MDRTNVKLSRCKISLCHWGNGSILFPWQPLKHALTPRVPAPVAAFSRLAPPSSSFFDNLLARLTSETLHPRANVEHVTLFQTENSVVIYHVRPFEEVKENVAVITGHSRRSSFEYVTIPRKHADHIAFVFLAVAALSMKLVDSGTRGTSCSIAAVEQHVRS